MMLILWRDLWYRGDFGRVHPWVGKLSLIVGMHMPRESSIVWTRSNLEMAATVDGSILSEMRYFPELRYRGYLVSIWNGWHSESAAPLLNVMIDLGDVSTGDLKETRRRVEALVADGWTWSWREGAAKYVHVDELEKIEGPPPEIERLN